MPELASEVWSLVKIGDIADIKTGKLDANAAVKGGGYKFFTCARADYQIDTYSFDADAIIIAGNGDLNVKRFKGKFDAYQRTYVLTSKDENVLDTQFFYYWESVYVETLRELSIGGVIKYIKLGMLKDAEMSLPAISEQKRIAEILTSVDDNIRATEAVIAQAGRVKRGLMEDLLTGGLGREAIARGEVPVGWRTDKLINLVTLKRGYDLPVSQRIEGKIPVVASNGPIGTHNKAAVTGPVVVTGRSGTIGKVQLYEHDCHPLNTTLYSQNLHGNDARFVTEFLRYFGLERFSTGTGVPTLNRNLVHVEKIVIPPIREQKKIASVLLALDELVVGNRMTTHHLQRLKRGLMDDLLTGRVRTV
jgi:type I restriction enzyme S subunit